MSERMLRLRKAAVGKADCVPVTAQISHHAARLASETTEQFYTDAETFLACELHAAELYELDSIPTHYDLYNIEAEALGASLIWKQNETPEADPSHPLLRSVDGWRKLRGLRIGEAGRMPFVLEINRRLIDMGLAAKVRFCGPVTLAAKLLGLEKLLVACVTKPQGVHGLMTFLTDEVIAPWITCQREQCGSNETAAGADAYASAPIMTPQMIRQFCLAYVQRLEKLVGNVRLAAIWGERHCENPRELLDIKRLAYPGVLQALDPDVTALGPALYKAYADEYGMSLVMGMDAGLIQRGPTKEIKARARWFIDQAGGNGRFVLFLNDVPYATPSQHVHAAVAAAHEYRY